MNFKSASLEQLRQAIGGDDAPARVYAAFELAQRLGTEGAEDLRPEDEEHPGVQMHWLTILASFGEHGAVAAVAEERASSAEGAHAIHLAAQLGIGDPQWLAARFNDAPERCRAALIKQGRDIDWAIARRGLEELLQSDTLTTRRAAAERLFESSGMVTSLKHYACAHPGNSQRWFEAWALGSEHQELLGQVAENEVTDAALQALQDAGRTFPISVLRDLLMLVPQAICLAAPLLRADLIELTDAALDRDLWLPEAWENALRIVASAPFSQEEAAVVRKWALAAVRENWWDGPPASGTALAAMGCAVQQLDSKLINGSAKALVGELDKGSTERLATALSYLLTNMRTEHGHRPLADVDGVIHLDVEEGAHRGYAWWVSDQTVVPWRLGREGGIVRVRLGDHQTYAKADLERLWRKGRFPAALTEWELFLGAEGAVLLPFTLP